MSDMQCRCAHSQINIIRGGVATRHAWKIKGQAVFPLAIKRSSSRNRWDQGVKAKIWADQNFDPGRGCQYSGYSSDHPLVKNIHILILYRLIICYVKIAYTLLILAVVNIETTCSAKPYLYSIKIRLDLCQNCQANMQVLNSTRTNCCTHDIVRSPDPLSLLEVWPERLLSGPTDCQTIECKLYHVFSQWLMRLPRVHAQR